MEETHPTVSGKSGQAENQTILGRQVFGCIQCFLFFFAGGGGQLGVEGLGCFWCNLFTCLKPHRTASQFNPKSCSLNPIDPQAMAGEPLITC
jgi:hypothetical protein